MVLRLIQHHPAAACRTQTAQLAHYLLLISVGSLGTGSLFVFSVLCFGTSKSERGRLLSLRGHVPRHPLYLLCTVPTERVLPTR